MTSAGTRAAPGASRLVGAAALAAWAAAALAASALRPGELLEFGLLGVAGLCAWPLLDGLARRDAVALGLVFLVPLVNTWPARAWVALVEEAGRLGTALLAPSTLLAGALLALAPAASARTSRAATAGAALLLAGAALSTALSDDPAGAASASLSAFGVPLATGAAVLALARRGELAWRLLAAVSLAALVPAGMGLGAYVLSFGVPASMNDLLDAKAELFRPFPFHEVTFGNVGHLAAFALLLLPAALVVATRPAFPRTVRTGAAASAALLAADLVLVLSRAALLAGAVALLAGSLVAAQRRHGPRSVAALLGAVLACVGATLVTQRSLEDGPTAVESRAAASLTESTDFRAGAVRTGVRIAVENPQGVGGGRYVAVDPEHGSPHSLALLVAAEQGVLGLAGLLALAAAVAVAGVAWWRTASTGSDLELLLGAGTGVVAFAGYAAFAGAPLAVGPVAAWGMLLAILAAVLLARSPRDRA